MNLTRKTSIELTRENWGELAERGCSKEGLDWSKYAEEPLNLCWLCEYDKRQGEKYNNQEMCSYCPYYEKVGDCQHKNAPYCLWRDAINIEDKKIYAAQVLEQLEELWDG